MVVRLKEGRLLSFDNKYPSINEFVIFRNVKDGRPSAKARAPECSFLVAVGSIDSVVIQVLHDDRPRMNDDKKRKDGEEKIVNSHNRSKVYGLARYLEHATKVLEGTFRIEIKYNHGKNNSGFHTHGN